MKKLTIRLSIVVLWICIIFAALYWPKMNFFSYQSNTINVFSWSDILDPKIVSSFEKETGIKVNFSYYASNEELLVKLKATKGRGYDLIIPSDYAVKNLIQGSLLKKIDRSKLLFWKDINPNLLGHFFDPKNQYSIPFEWEIFLIGINKDYFEKKPIPASWKLVFDPNTVHYKIAMTNDPIEATSFASFYLFGHKSSLTQTQIDQVKKLLILQKNWVEAYASFRGDYFLSTGNCGVTVASSSYLWRSLKLFPSLRFILPKEGTFIAIENLAIPRHSKKEDLTYQFINYLYSESSVRTHFKTYGYFPSTLQSLQDIEISQEAKALLHSSEEQFKKFHFIEEVMPQQTITDIWVEVKSNS
jgi:spermidine/putrescine transport system substrate-binding protein